MEQQKKKRVRPTVAQVIALEKTIDEYRNAHIEFKKKIDELERENRRLQNWRDDMVDGSKYNDLMAKNHTLEQSNALMEKELERLQESLNLALDVAKTERDKRIQLENRSWLDRLFNL